MVPNTVNPLDQLALTRLLAVAHRSAPLCGTPFIWRTPRGASSVPTSNSRYEYSECAFSAGSKHFVLAQKPNLLNVNHLLV